MQVLQALLEDAKGEPTTWAKHATVRMWKGYEHSFVRYSLAMCREWAARGEKDACGNMIKDLVRKFEINPLDIKYAEKPWWLGRRDVHLSHRSNLLRLDEEHYKHIFKEHPVDLPFVNPLGKEGAPVEANETEEVPV